MTNSKLDFAPWTAKYERVESFSFIVNRLGIPLYSEIIGRGWGSPENMN